MKFSILIPTLNEEKYLGKLLRSLTRQTFSDFEVIICDGRSTDKTLAVAAKFKSRLKLTLLKSRRRGTSYQRNLAASKAKSAHYIFFDADTQPEPNFLSSVSAALDDHQFQVATAWLNPLSDRLIDKFIFGSFNLLYQESVKNFSPVGTGVFLYVSGPAFKAVHGFDENLRVAEDYDLVRRLYQAKYKFHLIRRPTIPYSVRRLNKEGRLHFLANILRSGYYYHLYGPAHKHFQVAQWYNFGNF